jgi:shikimate dehydrogenase
VLTTLAGVLGFPVRHSRSPAMMNAAFAELGLDWRYLHLPVPPDRFGETVRALWASGFVAANVTLPHKHAAAEVADELTDAAAAIGAANTLTLGDGRIAADNTDAGGFLDALGESPAGRRVLVLGAGGAARAVVWALNDAGAAEVLIWNRTPERARALAAELGGRAVEGPEAADVLVNTTSVGLDSSVPDEEALAQLPLEGMDLPSVVVDLVYGPDGTPLTRWAEAGGARAVDGLEHLVRQGARSLEVWTGRPAPLDVMREAVQRAGTRG